MTRSTQKSRKTSTGKKKPAKKAAKKTRASSAKPKSQSSKKVAKPKASAKRATKQKTRKTRLADVKVEIVRSPNKLKPTPSRGRALTPEAKEKFKEALLEMREQVIQQIRSLQNDSLQRHDDVNSEEDGTDTFERQFALSIASSEQDALFEIDRALERLDTGKYGICEGCGHRVERARLKALPFVRMCIACQSDAEKGKLVFRAAEPKAFEGIDMRSEVPRDDSN